MSTKKITYLTEKGYFAFISKDTDGKYFSVFQRDKGERVCRLSKKYLPKRATMKEAQADLNKYAKEQEWKVVNMEKMLSTNEIMKKPILWLVWQEVEIQNRVLSRFATHAKV